MGTPSILPLLQLNATLTDFTGANVPNAQLIITLCGYGLNPPRIATSNVLAKVGPMIFNLVNGVATNIPIYGNDVITPIGTYYTIAVMDDKKNIVQCNMYVLVGSGSIDLSNLQPIIPMPGGITINSIIPDIGWPPGGTEVTITGSGFDTGVAVYFGDEAATDLVIVTSNLMTALTPAGTGQVDVTVTQTGAASATLDNGFTYVYFAITGVQPSESGLQGGTPVTISGTGFASGAEVFFGSIQATDGVQVVNETTITCLAPPGSSSGGVDVTISQYGQSSTMQGVFTYVAPPVITSVLPNSDGTDGGEYVTISGTSFSPGCYVNFGLNPATNVTVVNSTTITAQVPPGAGGIVNVMVADIYGQTSTLVNGFTYVTAPTLTGISPNSGPPAGETAVSITGTNLAGVVTVSFTLDSTFSAYIVGVEDTEIMCLTPAVDVSGVYDLAVINSVGQETVGANAFTFANPGITGVTPTSGTPAGGTAVQIDGADFYGTVTVTFDGVPATNVVATSTTQITCNTPAHTATGPVTVAVEVLGVVYSLTNGYSYENFSVIDLQPTGSNLPGGQTIIIYCDNLADDPNTTVSFGGVLGSGVKVDVIAVPAEIGVVNPPMANVGAVDVVVTNAGSSVTLPGGFTYFGTPTVGQISPNSGTNLGGTAVTISGADFLGPPQTTGVYFAGNPATNVTVVNSTTITCTTPPFPEQTGAVDVEVVNAGPNVVVPSGFTYTPSSISATAISPNSGTQLGGTSVTISGGDFMAGQPTTVLFGNTPATNVVVVNSTTITCHTPAGAGINDVTVTNAGNTAEMINAYTYTPSGVVGPTVRVTNAVAGVNSSYQVSWTSQAQVGDLCIICGAHQYSLAVPSGWTLQYNSNGPLGWNGLIIYRVLDANDVANYLNPVTISTASGSSGSGVFGLVVYANGTYGEIREGDVLAGSGSSQNLGTSNTVTNTDGMFYFGSMNSTGTCSVNRGTPYWATNDGVGGACCVYLENPGLNGTVVAGFMYQDANSNPRTGPNWQAIVVVTYS